MFFQNTRKIRFTIVWDCAAVSAVKTLGQVFINAQDEVQIWRIAKHSPSVWHRRGMHVYFQLRREQNKIFCLGTLFNIAVSNHVAGS